MKPGVPGKRELLAIRAAYRGKFALRSSLPYMRHIEQGDALLQFLMRGGLSKRFSRSIFAEKTILSAWYVHPLFQMDQYLTSGDPLPTKNPEIVLLGMEYRHTANAFLTKDVLKNEMPKKSWNDDVNLMLVVDKVQNWRDARIHLSHRLDKAHSQQLEEYFSRWRQVLGIDEGARKELESVLGRYE